MAKIAFNNSCGGFHLSDKAVQAYINASVQALRKTIPSEHAIRYGEIARHNPILISVIEQLGKYVCRVFELKVSIRHNSKSVFYKMSQCFKEAKWVVHNAICCIR